MPNDSGPADGMHTGLHVGVPFRLLETQYLDLFLAHKLNPEIGLDSDTLDDTPPAVFEAVAARLAGAHREVTLHAPFHDLSGGSPDRAILRVTRDRMRQILTVVPVFRPRHVVCHLGYEAVRYAPLKEAWLSVSLETWSWLARELAGLGSRLVLENVYETDPLDMLPVFEALAGLKVGFCLDLGHQHAFGKVPLSQWLARLDPYLAHLHLHDNRGDADSHLAPGTGTIDWQPLFQWWARRPQRVRVITLEPHRAADLGPGLRFVRAHRNLWGPMSR